MEVRIKANWYNPAPHLCLNYPQFFVICAGVLCPFYTCGSLLTFLLAPDDFIVAVSASYA